MPGERPPGSWRRARRKGAAANAISGHSLPADALKPFNRHASRLCISSITLAERMHGVEKSARPNHHRGQVEDFVSRMAVLEYGSRAAPHYGDILAGLKRRGMMIGINDLYIAGHARSEGMTLVTHHLKEFRRVEGPLLENWV